MEQVIFGGIGGDLDIFSTQYYSPIGDAVQQPEDWVRKVVSTDGTIKSLRVVLEGAPGAGKHYDFDFVLNGAPVGMTLEIADAAVSGSDMVTEFAVTGGDTISILSSPTGDPNGVRAAWSWIFEGDNANESLILGGAYQALDSGATEYGQLMGARTDLGGTENHYRQVMPTAGVLKNLFVELTADPGTDPDAYEFTVRLTGL
ncbi:unnamed protein product, partial [marine sediment metagenome]